METNPKQSEGQAIERRLCRRLFAISFVSLFLELLLIRWAPSVVRLVAYYANLLLLSSFLGLGLGAMRGGTNSNRLRWFPVLLAIDAEVLFLCRHAILPVSGDEVRFFSAERQALNYIVLLLVFGSNAIIFVPLGEEIGRLFSQLTALRAYTWDLLGSLCGTIAFGLFSSMCFSPVVGMGSVALIGLGLSERQQRIHALLAFLICLVVTWASNPKEAIWSPYYYITVEKTAGLTSTRANTQHDLRSSKDPPIYNVRVNQDFYQMHETIDLKRYSPDSPQVPLIQYLRDQYLLPYSVVKGRRRALVLGAGGGMDVQAALLSGVESVDAVDIDPQFIDLSRRINASGCYDDPRVTVHVDDARGFLENAKPGYDLVVFGFLDSQALFTSMSNLRLDGFTYTVESVRTAYKLLNEGGLLSLSFAAKQEWLDKKLVRLVADATGKQPIVFADCPQVIVCAPAEANGDMPEKLGRFVRRKYDPSQLFEIAVSTDDWPYLYLRYRKIPQDYLIVIGAAMAASLASILRIRRSSWGVSDLHFFLLGLGFLLLETKSIGDCSLYFGTSWMVTMIVIAGVLATVLAANLVATRVRFSHLWYIPLLTTLVLLYYVPHRWVLSLTLDQRVLWALAIVPLPILFAGVIFSTTFRGAYDAGALFGANLLGAMVGGFCEYLGMATGHSALTLLVIGAYAASSLCQRAKVARRAPVPTASCASDPVAGP
jgi:hypothetical protein